jgi:exonuclease III
MVYNVENLFDADGVAAYEDYQPAVYSPQHFRTKLLNLADILVRFDEGRGPDILLLQEMEIDQTPETGRVDPYAWLERQADRTVAELLSQDPLPAELAGLPAEVWLLKALADRGLTGYTAVSGDDWGPGRDEASRRAIKCVTLTRFPVRAVRQHPTVDARNILEVELEVAGARLIVFNNHWKSGASDPATEPVRIQNAQVLRHRLDALFAEDPQVDIIIGGDFNSQYNQKLRYPEMPLTALNDVLRSQGNELAIRGPGRDLYNLWFELPVEQRGNYSYRGEWSTLLHLILSRGLYDYRGVQYLDNSFGIHRVPGVNVDVAGAPVRWDGSGPAGRGYSDHLPIYARFQVVADERPDRWLALARPAQGETTAQPRAVDYRAADLAAVAVTAETLPQSAQLRDGSWNGRIFLVDAEVVPDRHPRVQVRGEEYEVYGVSDAVRDRLHEQRRAGRLSFYGELGTFKGRWQFVVRDVSWVQP